MAYAAGALEGSAHDDLRQLIADAGDTVATGTDTLTADYLDGVDVFYTGMLSGGTGMTAGDLGTLSMDEADALDAWLAAGGTLIVTVDSTGLPGDAFADVYANWGLLFGMSDLGFVTDQSTAAPAVDHALTTAVTTYGWINHTTFMLGDDAMVLGDATGGAAFLAVLEPSTGFGVGGRVLVLGDHNLFTDNGIGTADNATLAANLVGWAQGECGNTILEGDEACDDGNLDDGDGCSSTCAMERDEGTSSSGGDSSGESGGSTGDSTSSGTSGEVSGSSSSTGGESSSGGPGTTTDTTTSDTPQTSGSPSGETTPGETDTETDTGASSGSGGCTQGGRPRSTWAWLLLCVGVVARRRR